MTKENFTIVIPAYNEEGTIRDVVKRALKQCKSVIDLLGKISIIIVSLALLAGCGAALVRNVDSAMIAGNHSVANIEKAIVRAGTGLV
jgi:cellulose synthase/poly-beta-1,6-N-acetylglucosamine synthase-like glycosyltransferase